MPWLVLIVCFPTGCGLLGGAGWGGVRNLLYSISILNILNIRTILVASSVSAASIVREVTDIAVPIPVETTWTGVGGVLSMDTEEVLSTGVVWFVASLRAATSLEPKAIINVIVICIISLNLL